MSYPDNVIKDYLETYHQLCADFDRLLLETVIAGQQQKNSKVREDLLYGVSRRIGVIKKSTENIFNIFSLYTKKPLLRDELDEVQINMHAYVVNLSGIFDNWAWAFVHKHDLLEDVGGKLGVGMFNKSTKALLPKEISSYLVEKNLKHWHEQYLKSFRDSLAHRIPLYIPPSIFTPAESELYQSLETKKSELIKSMDWKKLEEIKLEQSSLGSPCFYFINSFAEKSPKQVLIHPQLLSDGLTIIEFGDLFMKHWESVACNK